MGSRDQSSFTTSQRSRDPPQSTTLQRGRDHESTTSSQRSRDNNRITPSREFTTKDSHLGHKHLQHLQMCMMTTDSLISKISNQLTLIPTLLFFPHLQEG